MAVLGFVIFFSFVACIIGIIWLLSNCFFEFGVNPAVRRFANWYKLSTERQYVEIYVHPATKEQIELAVDQELRAYPSLKDTFESREAHEECLRRCDKFFGGMLLRVPVDEPLPDNFLRYKQEDPWSTP